MGRDRDENEELSARARALVIRESPNLNHFWARLMVEELFRNFVSQFVISPGSRSTPLALAAVNHPKTRHFVHYDERGAAFFALGLAQRIGHPVALVCTSGSAAANYLPAVVEASQSAVPLILLTADRPPELIGCGANQAILQDGLYGAYARWSTTMPCPTTEIPARFVLSQIDEACARAIFPPHGPVHVNCPFREPLGPADDGVDLGPALASLEPWLEYPYTHAGTLPTSLDTLNADSTDESVMAMMEEAENPFIVFGAVDKLQTRANMGLLKAPLPVPVFVDPLTSTMNGALLQDNVCIHGDLLFRSAVFREIAIPDMVVLIGGPILSKSMNDWLANYEGMVVQVTQDPRRFNASHGPWGRFVCDIDLLARWLESDFSTDDQPRECTIFSHLDRLIDDIVDGWLEKQKRLTEIGVACLVARMQPDFGLFFIGNSMPIRDMATYGMHREMKGIISANRGASGIDGTIATAAGTAVDALMPLTIVIGDLALLHDVNSLPLLQYRMGPVVVVVINNDGGGIFHMLPVALEADAEQFEEVFGTPHGLRFKEIAKAFGFQYRNPTTPKAFIEAYMKGVTDQKRMTLIEVNTDRKENASHHRVLNEIIVSALDELLGEAKTK